MTLPVVTPKRKSVPVGDAEVTIRGLSRAEVMELAGLRPADGDPTPEVAARAEAFLIEKATGASEAEARRWHAATDSDVVEALVAEISKLSGLRTDADPKPDTSGTS